MTNELEKQFFQCFGIEPKYESHSCDGWGRTVEIRYFKDKKKADKFGMVFDEAKYPIITDSILLKLLCLCPDLDDVFFTDIGQLKETLLNSYIKIYTYYTEVERLSDCEKELKHQVRTLFEEGK